MIIDFHTHNFPDALAPKAMASLKINCAANPDIVAHTDGTASDAERLLRSSGVDRAVVCNIATNSRQENKVNSYSILLLESDFFLPLGSLHPDSENKREELARLKDNLLASFAAEKVISSVTVSDKDARDFYDANPDKFLSDESVNASHILVDTEEKARELIAKLNAFLSEQ